MENRKLLADIKYNRLTPIEKVRSNSHRQSIWLFRCDCGNEIEVPLYRVKNGNTKSCGCLKKEMDISRNNNKIKQNEYILINKDTMQGCTFNTKRFFYFDLEDYDKVKKYCWHESSKGYIASREKTANKIIKLHHLVFHKPQKGNDIDHIDRNKLNNKKENLREISHRFNSINTKIPKNNTSGFIGITWDKEAGKWQAFLSTSNKRKNLGRFLNKEDAIVARLEAELKYFGEEFAPQRHLFEEYGIGE